jgi:hypothetical protein
VKNSRGFYCQPRYFVRGRDVLRGQTDGLQTIVCVAPNEQEARTVRDLLQAETKRAYEDGADDIEHRVKEALGI